MGRPRKKNRHLPERMQRKGDSYYYTPFIDGKVKWKSLGDDYGDALRQWAELERTALTPAVTFDDLCREFQLRVVPNWRESTRKLYPYWQGNLLKTFGGVHLTDIKAQHIYGHVEKRELEGKRSAGLRERSVLGSMLEFARKNGWIETNPAQGVRMAKEKGRQRYIEDHEYAAIYLKANPVVRVAMELAYITGLRIGDLLKLKRTDADLGGLRLEQSKARVKANYRMTEQLEGAIGRAKALRTRVGAIYLLCRRDGKPYTYRGFTSMWERAVEASKVENVHFHDIRAKATTDAADEGRDPQAFTLHASPEMAEQYVKRRRTKVVEPMALRSKMLSK